MPDFYWENLGIGQNSSEFRVPRQASKEVRFPTQHSALSTPEGHWGATAVLGSHATPTPLATTGGTPLRVRGFAIDGNRQDCDPLTATQWLLKSGNPPTGVAPQVEQVASLGMEKTDFHPAL
ncbi:hypothetical protein [Nostoc sp.]|uniref:hypothetical protein n=1 Tax=Nostoc sp. TaxID=1180 RepID=UPI002FF88765